MLCVGLVCVWEGLFVQYNETHLCCVCVFVRGVGFCGCCCVRAVVVVVGVVFFILVCVMCALCFVWCGRCVLMFVCIVWFACTIQ